jgi:hypothetical protein
MTPTFSDEEYRRVMMLTYLGEWVLNAIRKDPDPAYLDTASKIYSFAKGTALESLVTFDANDESWNPSQAFEDEAHALIDQYDDKTFWEELTARMTERDLIESRGERAVRGMRPDQRTRAASAIAQAYTKEFEEQGLDRLRVQEDS